MRFYALFTTFKPSRPILMDEIDKIIAYVDSFSIENTANIKILPDKVYNFKGKQQVLSGRKVKPEMQVQAGFYFS